jgi:hypothetical protein
MFVFPMGGIYEVDVEMVSDCAIYIPSFMTIDCDIKLIIRLLSQQFERLQCWYS